MRSWRKFQIWRFSWVFLRATENVVAAHIWPASRYLPTPAVHYFSNVLSEILFTDSWRKSFVKLPIPKLSLHNSAAFLSSAKALQRFAWKSNFLTYTLASLNYTLSVSEYVTTNVKAQPVKFLRETNNGCTVVSHMCSCNALTVAIK